MKGVGGVRCSSRVGVVERKWCVSLGEVGVLLLEFFFWVIFAFFGGILLRWRFWDFRLVRCRYCCFY